TQLAATCERYYGEFHALIERSGVPLQLQHVGPRFGMYFGVTEPVTNYREAACQNKALLYRFIAGCIQRGVYFHVAAHHGFSAAHDEKAIDRALEGIAGSLNDIRRVL
ncbi:MAG TPA: hypothetical protein VFT99_16195, partial [Roseiflexaceae bacterium]|nr:hypothetical protein [Roseiflexaceae bacterium]